MSFINQQKSPNGSDDPKGLFCALTRRHHAGATLRLVTTAPASAYQCSEDTTKDTDMQGNQKVDQCHYYNPPLPDWLDEGRGRGKYVIEFKSVKGMISCPSIKIESAEHGT